MARITSVHKDRRWSGKVNKEPVWNARRGHAWADLQPLLDRLFLPFGEIIIDATLTDRIRDVLDIGCGTGATTLAFARRRGAGRCTGIDVSLPLLNVARRRAEAEGLANAQFLEGDAQRHHFAPHTFDAVISRFGVMFFDDPTSAFANIRGAIRPAGTLTGVVWRSRSENPFMMAGELAAAPLLGWTAPADPDALGQFAFADAARVEKILRDAGWDAIDISPIDVPCRLPAGDLSTYVRRMGRVGMTLPDLEEGLRATVEVALDEAFAGFVTDGAASFDCACWLVRARNPPD